MSARSHPNFPLPLPWLPYFGVSQKCADGRRHFCSANSFRIKASLGSIIHAVAFPQAGLGHVLRTPQKSSCCHDPVGSVYGRINKLVARTQGADFGVPLHALLEVLFPGSTHAFVAPEARVALGPLPLYSGHFVWPGGLGLPVRPCRPCLLGSTPHHIW